MKIEFSFPLMNSKLGKASVLAVHENNVRVTYRTIGNGEDMEKGKAVLTLDTDFGFICLDSYYTCHNLSVTMGEPRDPKTHLISWSYCASSF